MRSTSGKDRTSDLMVVGLGLSGGDEVGVFVGDDKWSSLDEIIGRITVTMDQGAG